MKKITDLWEKECICCTTQEECDIIMDMMHDAGLKWCTGKSYKEYRTNHYLPNHVYQPYYWVNGSEEIYQIDWYTIYPASDFIEAKRQPKQGEWVLVSNHNYDDRVKRIFLCEIPFSLTPYVCVNQLDESDYLKWAKLVRHNTWDTIKQLPTTSTYTIECTEEQYEKVKDILNSK